MIDLAPLLCLALFPFSHFCIGGVCLREGQLQNKIKKTQPISFSKKSWQNEKGN